MILELQSFKMLLKCEYNKDSSHYRNKHVRKKHYILVLQFYGQTEVCFAVITCFLDELNMQLRQNSWC